MIKVGIIGYGYWGPNLVRNFNEVADAAVVAVSDLNSERLALAHTRYPGIEMTTDYHELLSNPRIDAIAIATPVSTHYDLAMQALQAGKHVLVEKPITATSQQAIELIEKADRYKLVLMVDHTFIYTGAVRKIQELIASNTLGNIYYYDSARVNLGLFRHDINVIWDLAVHDLSIMDFVLTSKPYAVSATGLTHVPNQPENIAYLTLFFGDCLISHVHVNWLAPVKLRRTLVGGSEKMIVYDDLEPSEKVKVYDSGITINNDIDSIYQVAVGYRTGDMWAPRIDLTEGRLTEVRHFVQCIEEGCRSISSGEAGLRVVKILEASTLSMSRRGNLVEIDTGRFVT